MWTQTLKWKYNNNIKEKWRLQLQVGKLPQIPLVVFVQILKVLCCACCDRRIANEIWGTGQFMAGDSLCTGKRNKCPNIGTCQEHVRNILINVTCWAWDINVGHYICSTQPRLALLLAPSPCLAHRLVVLVGIIDQFALVCWDCNRMLAMRDLALIASSWKVSVKIFVHIPDMFLTFFNSFAILASDGISSIT